MKNDQMSSLAWLGLALFIGVEVWRKMPVGEWNDPGAGFWPLGAALLLGGLSAVNFLKSSLDKSPEDRAPWYPRQRWRAIVLIMASLMAYVFLLEWIGFLLGTFLLMAYLFRSAEPQRWAVAIGGSALISAATYLVFDIWLKTQLPKGILGF
ncbi:MAG: tripartite tricarboxylate transporter TctB family protein [Deltaproteobacteria bacterium]|nr:tripartite tricarboxylate transporter TctB family protein [Deltaproteobacteria bacterium]